MHCKYVAQIPLLAFYVCRQIIRYVSRNRTRVAGGRMRGRQGPAVISSDRECNEVQMYRMEGILLGLRKQYPQFPCTQMINL